MERKLKRIPRKENIALLESVTSKKRIAEKLIDVRRSLDQGGDVNTVDTHGRTLLYLAVGHGNVLLVKLLLKHGADVNAKDVNDETPLHHAVRNNRASAVELLLAKGADLNAQSVNGSTPLHIAAQLGLMNIIEVLLHHGADIKSQDKYGTTLLHEAASSGKFSIVNFLLNEGADVNVTDQFGQTPLHCASKSGVVHVVQLLIDKGADVFKQAGNGDTPLHYAARSGKLAVVRLLVNKGIGVNPFTVRGDTPLHEALRSKEIEIIVFLLNEGADVNYKTYKGETPLHTASLSNNYVAVSLLLNKGAKVDVKTEHGFTPLHYAARTSDINIVQLLVSYGAEINSQDENGNTPLHMAIFYLRQTVTEYLLNNGADANIQSQTGNTPLHSLIEQLSLDYSIVKMNFIHTSTYPLIPLEQKLNKFINKRMIQIILRKGASANVQNIHGMTPLHLAAKYCLSFAVDVLLKNGADINLRDRMGNTPLHEALKEKRTASYEVVKLLLTKKFDINIRNLEGKTALHLATKIEVTPIEEWLRQSPDLKTSETLHWTLWNCATEDQELSIIQLLLDFGADVNAQDIYGNTPIHEAAIYGSTITMLQMLKKNADINMQNFDGETPLHIAVRHQYDELATMLIARGSDVMIRNKDGGTPLKYASMMSFGKRRKLTNALQTAEEKAKCNISIKKPVLSFSPQLLQKSPQIYEYNYSRKTDNFGLPGQLYETKLVSLVFIRLLNYDKIDHRILIGINIDGIGAMDDICCRCQAKDQEKPFIIFIQAKHRQNLTDKIKNKDLWGISGDFSLIKYFKSYLLIRKQFEFNNNDPMFEGAFCDVDCYLILYTSAIDNITKKNTHTKINEKVHDLRTSKPKLQPFQYDYDESDINKFSEAVGKSENNSKSNLLFNNCESDHVEELIKDFFSKLWFYTNQDQEDKIENLVKDEINMHYNDIFIASNPNFQSISSNSIFSNAHHEIQKWWMMKDAAYLRRENDFFRSAKLTFLDELLAISCNTIKTNKCKVDFELNERFYETQTSEEANRDISTIMSSFVKFIEKNNKLFTTTIDSKNIIISFSQTDQTEARILTLPVADTSYFNQLLSRVENTISSEMYDNKQFQYSKRDGTSEASGAMYRRNLICVIHLRLLHHRLIDENPKLTSKIRGINLMNDICLRYTVKRQQKPIAVFMQLIHREDPNKGKLTEESFWSDHSDFSLRNYFKSYVSIKERFQGINADPMFEGDFHNIDCYFVIYTSAKENHRKKKNINKIDKIVKDLTLTSHKSKIFQHEYTDDEIKLLADLIIDDEIENLGIAFQKCILSERNNPLSDKFIKRYHVVLAQHVLKQCDQQPNQTGNEKYRLWQFRPDFFTKDQHYLFVLKKTIIKALMKKNGAENEIIIKLQSLIIKLPFEFGNLDMKFSGGEAKVRKRIQFLVDKLADLLEQHKETKIVEIKNEDVGPGKIIEQGIIEVNGGIGSAVGNLLIVDTDTDMLKFNLESEILPHNSALFLKELENKGCDDLSAYRFNINVTGFPKLSFEANEFDKVQVTDFMNKIWFFTDQAKHDEVEQIFTNEFKEIFAQKSDLRVHNYDKSDILGHISLLSLDKVQKWMLLPYDSPYLSRLSKLFECADQEATCNILLNFMNFMYISNVCSFNVSVDSFNGNPKLLQPLFNKIVINLFKIFDPQYDADISRHRYHSVDSEKTTLCIKIHQDMEWVALIMTSIKRSKYKNADVRQCLVAEAGPIRKLDGVLEEFKIYELHWFGQMYIYKDCIKNTTKEIVKLRKK